MGKLVKSKETFRRSTIELVHRNATESNIALYHRQQGHNPTNCITVSTSSNIQPLTGSSNQHVPSFLLSNVQSFVPLHRSQQPKTKHKILSCDRRPSARMAISTYLQEVMMLDTVNTCEEKHSMLKTGLDFILPLKLKTIHSNEPPWISATLKDLIKKRQKALAQGHVNKFKQLRNRVNRECKLCRSKFYAAKIQHLKDCQPSTRWKEVKRICGMTSPSSSQNDLLRSLQHLEGVASRAKSDKELANIFNASFLAPMSEFEPLPQSYLSDFNTNAPASPALKVTTDAVFQKLSTLNQYKAHGADNIPNWILKENADLLSQPVSDILNCSYHECRLPQSWEEANVVPVPKQKPVKDVNKHLRLISLTPVLSKIAEDFVVEEFMKPAVTAKIDNNQYSTVPKSSTTQALVSMAQAWSKHTDGNGATVRVVLFYFRKAFDLLITRSTLKSSRT